MIKLVSDTINKNDINSLIKWLNQDEIPRLTKGDLTWELEEKWAKKIGTKYSIYVNSGSSSILLTLAALQANDQGEDPILVVTPADQTVRDQEAFTRSLHDAIEVAGKGSIVVLGIKPNKPDTGFGYIKKDKLENHRYYKRKKT